MTVRFCNLHALVLIVRQVAEHIRSGTSREMHSSLHALICGDGKSASRAAAYYTAGLKVQEVDLSAEVISAMVDYYAQEDQGNGRAAKYFGRSAEKLGLVSGSAVKPKELTRLLQLLDPRDRSSLPSNGGRKAKISALDLTFSLEKDADTLWLLADQTERLEIEIMMDESVHAGVEYYQKQACVVRRGSDGIVKKTASGFIAIETDHQYARPVDDNPPAPSLHRHFLMINAAELEGSFTALDSKRLYNLQMVAGAIAGQRMRELTAQRFGLAWEREKKGVHRVVGFDKLLRQKLSPRSREILDRVLADGGDPTSRGDMIKAQRASRSGKDVCGSDHQNDEEIIEDLAKDGVTFESLLAGFHRSKVLKEEKDEQVRRDRNWIDTTFPPCPQEAEAAQRWRETVARELATFHTFDTSSERFHETPRGTLSRIPLAYDRLNAALDYEDRMDESKRAHDIMMEVGRDRSTWILPDLLYALSDQGIEIDSATRYANEFIKSSKDTTYLWGIDDDAEAIVRPTWSDQARFATVETLRKEKAIVQATKDGVGAREALLTSEQYDEVLLELASRGVVVDGDSDQEVMLCELLLRRNTISVVEGQAGSGKTVGMLALGIALDRGYLGEPANAVDEKVASHCVVGCALTARAAKILSREAEIPAYSLTMLVSRLDQGKIKLDPGAIVVVDEVSQAPTASLYELVEYVQAVEGRLVLAGDTRQLQAVSAGGLVPTLLREAPDAVVVLDETLRQKSKEERAVLATIHYRGLLSRSPHAVQALLKQGVGQDLIDTLVGDGTQEAGLKAALEWYKSHNRVRIHASAEAAMSAVGVRYWDVVEKSSKSIEKAVIISTRSNQEADTIHVAVVAEAVTRGLLDADQRLEFARRQYLKGERVSLRQVDWDLGVFNGDSGTVVGVEDAVLKWKVEYDSPLQYAVTRELTSKVSVGEKSEVRFTARQVASLRTKAQKDFSKCKATVTSGKQSSAVAAAEKCVQWANSLPTKGGTIELVVKARNVLNTEECLIVDLDNGERRALPTDYVESHVGSGYAVTAHKAQGDKSEVSISYNNMGYVPASRGTDLNLFEMVVEPNDDVIVEKDRMSLSDTYEWLSSRLGEEEAKAAIANNAAREFTDLSPLSSPIDVHVTVSMMSTTRAMNDQVSHEIASSHLIGERHVAVVRSREMAVELNNAVVDQLKAVSGKRIYSPKIGDNRWVKGMPVIVAKGEIEGLNHGETYFVAALTKDSLSLSAPGGNRVEVRGDEVAKHLDPAFVITAARLREGIDNVDKVIGIAPGLDSDQLNLLGSLDDEVEIVVPDPDVTGALAWVKEMDAGMLGHLVKDSGTGWDSRSASDMLAWREGEEIGLKGLQGEVARTVKRIDEVSKLAPREVLARDIERELIGLRNRQKDLVEQVKKSEYEEDRLDAQSGLEKTERDIVEANDRYKIVTSGLSNDNPQVEEEFEKSNKHHGEDASHLIEVEKLLRHFVQARVTAATKNPQPYHPSLSTDPNLSVEAAYKQRQELIVAIEEYRTQWGITDTRNALGSDELEVGIQRDHYDRVARLLSEDDVQTLVYAHAR